MWYNKVVKDLSNVSDAIEFFNGELLVARTEVSLTGGIEYASSSLPGHMEYRFSQLQEIEAILEYLNIALRRERAQTLRKFMEHYNREMSSREAEKWVDGEDDIVTMSELINEVALVRNKYLGIIKSLEIKAFQINNITKLKVVGLDDAEIGFTKR